MLYEVITYKIKAIEKIIGAEFTKGHIPEPKEICEIQLMNLVDKVISAEVKENDIDRITSYNVCYTKLLRIFNKAQIGIGVLTSNLEWLKVNNSLLNLLGYSGEELIHTSFLDLVLEIDRHYRNNFV